MIHRPKIESIPLESGRSVIQASGWVTQEKKDGVWSLLTVGNSVLAGEQMKDGTFWAFDLPIFRGADIRRDQYRSRLDCLSLIHFPPHVKMIPSGSGGEYLEAIIRDGGEGVVFKCLSAPWGKGQFKCKRTETFDCVVCARHEATRSLSLTQFKDGTPIDCGRVASLSASEWDSIRVGDVVEILCHRRTNTGKFREPRVFRARPDKLPSDCLA